TPASAAWAWQRHGHGRRRASPQQVRRSQRYDDLAEDVPRLQPRQRRVDLVEADDGVDHRTGDAGRHLVEHGRDIADGAAETADEAELARVELEQVDLDAEAGGRAAGDQD